MFPPLLPSLQRTPTCFLIPNFIVKSLAQDKNLMTMAVLSTFNQFGLGIQSTFGRMKKAKSGQSTLLQEVHAELSQHWPCLCLLAVVYSMGSYLGRTVQYSTGTDPWHTMFRPTIMTS